jgi:hypothetical protein
MSLDKNKLSQDLKTAFKNAKDNLWSSDQAAEAIAAAIDGYVKAAVVAGVRVDVVDPANQPIGTGTQTGTVTIQ